MREEGTGVRDSLIGVPACFVAGVLVGTLGTFKHQVGVSAATGTGPPIGLVLSIAMLVLLLAALRLSFPSRRYALAAALGAIAVCAVLLLGGPGGSRVVLLNYAGLIWAVAPAVVSAVVVGWPRRAGRAQRTDGILVDGHEEGRLG
ncbi:hypothetical protein [Amnibacterium endophyticum]|uniref:Histidinol dehydrogenase n=1 Tax=Amnibacterium endophyticum TaxID=2109337 RepID=A0ABW4LC02_9MICO